MVSHKNFFLGKSELAEVAAPVAMERQPRVTSVPGIGERADHATSTCCSHRRVIDVDSSNILLRFLYGVAPSRVPLALEWKSPFRLFPINSAWQGNSTWQSQNQVTCTYGTV